MDAPPHFTVFGVPVRVEPFFFVIIALLGLAYGEPLYIATWVGLAFVSVLVHELGHAAAFRHYGHQPSILLHGFGGLTSARAALTPGRSIVVSLAGPLSAMVLLGGPAWLAVVSGWGDMSPEAEVILFQALFINIGWSLLNLLPILPLDGGNVTAAVLEYFTPRNARRIAAGVSVVVAVALGLVAVAYGLVFGALVAGFFAFTNLRELRSRPQQDVADKLVGTLQALLAGDAAAAEQLARAALASVRHPDDQRWLRELVAWCRLFQGDAGPAASLSAAAASQPDNRPSSTLEAGVALASGRVAEGLSVMAWALVNEPRSDARVLGALLTARLGLAPQVVDELVRLDGGREGAALLRDVLQRTGDLQGAQELERRIAEG